MMELPRKVVTGTGVISEVTSILSDLELGERTLVVSGPNVRMLLEQSLSSALDRGRTFQFTWETVHHASFAESERIAKLAKESHADFLVGVGGGKSIDIAKLASFNCNMPFVSIPTSASHDGISSPFASLKGLDRPYSVVARPPVAIIADIEVISSASPRLLISGCGDLISKETAVRDWELAHEKRKDYFGRYSASLALLSATLVMDNAKQISRLTPDGIRTVVEALISAGVAAGIAGSSRPCSGSEHLFSHAMDIVAPGKGMHGEKCGIGAIMMAKLHGIDEQQIRKALETLYAPTRAREISATEEEIVKALVLAGNLRKERYTILDEVKLNETSAKKLALDAQVI